MKHLFLVDPDPTRLCILDVSLRRAGYEVATASDGAEALEKIVWEVPDLVITEVTLPQIDGFALVENLRADPALASLPVLFVASERSNDDQQRALNLRVDGFLTRPVSVRELVAHIELNLARRARESVHAPGEGRGREGFTGSTRDLALADLLQNIASLGESGITHVRSGIQEAHIFFRDGRIVDAELGPLRGREAVYRVLAWEEASFHVEFKPVSNQDIVRRSTRVVVMEGMRQVDDWMRLCRLVQPLADLVGVSASPLLERLRAAGEGPEALKAMASLTARSDVRNSWPEVPATLLPRAAPRVLTARMESVVDPVRTAPIATPVGGFAPSSIAATADARPQGRVTQSAEATVRIRPEQLSPERPSHLEEDPVLADFTAQHNMPSDAPWAREATDGAGPHPEDDAVAAGVPSVLGRRAKRVAVAFTAVAVVLGLGFSLHAQRTREQREAEAVQNRSDVGAPIAAAAAAPPPVAPPEAPAPAPGASLSAAATGAADKPSPAEGAVTERPAVAAMQTGGGPDLGSNTSSAHVAKDVGGLAAIAALAPAPAAREKPLPTHVEMRSVSPLVRDAQRLLLSGDTERAGAVAQTAVTQNALDADAWLTLAATRKAVGDVAGATDAYRSCIAQARTAGVADCRALGLRPEGVRQ